MPGTFGPAQAAAGLDDGYATSATLVNTGTYINPGVSSTTRVFYRLQVPVVPQGATVSNVSVQLATYWQHAAAISTLKFQLADTDNFGQPAAYSDVWGIAATSGTNVANPNIPTYDTLYEWGDCLSAELDAVFARPGWSPGNYIGILIDWYSGTTNMELEFREYTTTLTLRLQFDWTEAVVDLTDYPPTSDVAVTGWTPSAGGTVYGVVDESPASDTDYAYDTMTEVS